MFHFLHHSVFNLVVLCFNSFYIRTNKIVCVIETGSIIHGVRSGMSSLQLSPPEAFDFKCPDNWQKWRRRFQQYCEASGLSAESDARQVNTFLYCLGEEANDVLASTHISITDRKVFSKVMEKLDEYFKVRHNVIFERANSIREISCRDKVQKSILQKSTG